MARPLLILVVALGLSVPTFAQSRFAGTWTGEAEGLDGETLTVTLTLEDMADGSLRGQIHHGDFTGELDSMRIIDDSRVFFRWNFAGTSTNRSYVVNGDFYWKIDEDGRSLVPDGGGAGFAYAGAIETEGRGPWPLGWLPQVFRRVD